jgi:hypothetical protein
LFSQILSTLTLKYLHPFGCPVYVLTKPDEKGSKWEERSRIGINLGNSPTHAGRVSLVLNIETGLVSPQFHVEFDDLFNTVPTQQLQIRWQQRTRFMKSDELAPTEPPVPDMYLLPLQETRQTGCQVVLNLTLPSYCCYQEVAYLVNWFCSGLSSCRHWNGHLCWDSKWIRSLRLKRHSLSQTHKESLWSEASWTNLEQTSKQRTHWHWIWTKQG